MARKKITVDVGACNRDERLEKLGIDELADNEMFDRLLEMSEKHEQMKEAVEQDIREREKEIKRETEELEEDKRRYGLKN